MTKLRRCPLCGAPNNSLFITQGDCEWWVMCDECSASSGPKATKEEAITAWNTRADDAELAPLRELRKRVRKLEKLTWTFKSNHRHLPEIMWVEILSFLKQCEEHAERE